MEMEGGICFTVKYSALVCTYSCTSALQSVMW